MRKLTADSGNTNPSMTYDWFIEFFRNSGPIADIAACYAEVTGETDLVSLFAELGCTMSGSAASSMLDHQVPKDLDLYFKSHEDFEAAVQKFEELGKVFDPVYASKNAITYRVVRKGPVDGVLHEAQTQIQLCRTRIYRNPIARHRTFDFQHCMFSVDFRDRKVIFAKRTLECIFNKKLIFNTAYPNLNAIVRMSKFLNRDSQLVIGNVSR
jgi:hypothetical protein